MRVIAKAMVTGAAMLALVSCGGGSDSAGEDTLPDTETADTSAADEADARSFIENTLDAYNSGNPVNYMGDPATVFEPDLANAIAALNAEGDATGTVPDALGADVICGCQDYEDISYDITELTVDGKQAVVDVTVTNFGESADRTFTLSQTRSGWRIYDIDDGFRASVMGEE